MRAQPEEPSTRIDRYTLTFDDESAERRFRDEHNERATRTTRLAIAAGAPGYVLILVVVQDAGARWFALAMIAALGAWFAIANTRSYTRHYEAFTAVGLGVTTGLFIPLVLQLPPNAALVVGLAFTTINFTWIFLFLQPRFPVAVVIGAVYFVAIAFTDAVIWDHFGGGRAPEGLIDPLGGLSGGLALVAAYAGFLLVLSASVAYRLERSERTDFLLREELDLEHDRSERLLTNVLPVPVARRLKDGESPIADDCDAVSVVFADITGFTAMSSEMDPNEVVALLDEVFTRFDELAVKHGLEKIKTIGDAYMAVAGVPEPMPEHARAAADMALEMVDAVRDVRRPDGAPVTVRVGIGSGPAVAGVIGQTKFAYDLWGDTVNTASRMESQGVPGRIQVSDGTKRLLEDDYRFESRGPVSIKGKGSLPTWFLVGRR